MRGRSSSNTSSGVDWVRAVLVSGEAARSGSIAGKRQRGTMVAVTGILTPIRGLGGAALASRVLSFHLRSRLLRNSYSHFDA
jgi:hypothetical protein